MSDTIDGDVPENYKKKIRLVQNNQNLTEEEKEIEILNPVKADSLRYEFTLPEELIEGILLSNGVSVIYGDSNCGKTFLAIDMACCIARGIKWMNKNVEQGMIVYLATEGPTSVEMRLHAYQKYFNVIVSNFVIIKKPINFFENAKDTKLLIRYIRYLELKHGMKVKMVIGDTLASLSGGANENAGQDMGKVINRINDIRNQCKTHFCLIHHSGKNASAGARGWSGIRAAIDTEIEVTETGAGKCAEITKLRDIGKKGEKFGFRLIPTVIGLNKWKQPVTSCIVQSADVPISDKHQKLGEIGNAIIGFLAASSEPIFKQVLAQNLTQYLKKVPSSIYRELKKLEEKKIIINNQNFISLQVPSTS